VRLESMDFSIEAGLTDWSDCCSSHQVSGLERVIMLLGNIRWESCFQGTRSTD
jgi:hypothetical protein